MKLAIKTGTATCVVLSAFVLPALAQQGIKRTPLGTLEFPPGYQTIMGIAEIAPGVCAGRHTHPGIETSYILDGQGVSKVEGKPD
jgi:quercetin dioxygenase-like cupin family protein